MKYYGPRNFVNSDEFYNLNDKIKCEFEYRFQLFIESAIDGHGSSHRAYSDECITILRLMRDVGIISEDIFNDAFKCVNSDYMDYFYFFA